MVGLIRVERWVPVGRAKHVAGWRTMTAAGCGIVACLIVSTATGQTDGSGGQAQVSSTTRATQAAHPDLVPDFFKGIERDDVAAVQAALRSNPELVDATAKGAWTPIHLAAHVGAGQATRLLLEAGADRESRFQNKTPLGLAIICRKASVARILVEAGANLYDVNGEGQTALHVAAQKGLNDIIELLLERGMDVNRRTDNQFGVTPLQDAALEGQYASVQLLLDRGAGVNIVSTSGFTPLDDAMEHPAIVALLRAHGARTADELRGGNRRSALPHPSVPPP